MKDRVFEVHRREQESDSSQPSNDKRATGPPRQEQRLSQPKDRENESGAGRPDRALAAHRGYFRWLRFSRLAQAAFVVLAVIFLIWALPWLLAGFDTEDYPPEVAFTVFLLLGVALAAILASIFQGLARRDRETLILLSEVFDQATGLRTRTYLEDRLALECERARRGGSAFSVLILQIRVTGSTPSSTLALPPHALEELAQLIDRQTHRSDLVAQLSEAELAILATAADKTTRVALLQRLRMTVEAALPQLLQGKVNITVKCGAATYGEDGTQPHVLIQTARADSIVAMRRGNAA